MKLLGWTFYNPFKWHVIRTPKGGYYRRKYSVVCVEYLSVLGVYLTQYSGDAFSTYLETINAINKHTTKPKKDEVIHEAPKTTN
jgi:hypothetical protein